MFLDYLKIASRLLVDCFIYTSFLFRWPRAFLPAAGQAGLRLSKKMVTGGA
jgi:hypothetical protein